MPAPHLGAIASLFTRYGFRPGYSSEPSSHVVFTIRSGYFHQAEILVLDGVQAPSVESTRRELEEAGFACSTRAFAGLEDLENRLFQGFFGVEDSRERQRQHYKAFVQRIERTTGGTYSYVAAPYYRDETLTRDRSVVDDILAELVSPKPTLVLIEAAAGFGKTCTAYEILSELLARQPDRPPLFVELARNRQAPLFRYVLLDEIDRNYPSLRSELVTSEIASGKVPLIIDGFDELLRRSIDVDTAPQDEATNKLESMLDTIAALLTGHAKVILTTRKTSMFSASSFEAWTAARSDSFRSVRFILQEPSLRDWLGPDRTERVEALGSMARALANPVLLAFLRGADDQEFDRYVADPDALVGRYFQSLLERELERQDINIDHPTQLEIYRQLASGMMSNDIMADSRAVIAEMIRDASRPILEDSLRRYPPASRPTLEQLSEKLAGHALLDRVGSGEDQVGFVNEFVAGTLFGDVLLTSHASIYSEKVLDLATWSYQVRNADTRSALFDATGPLQVALMPLERLSVALRLLGRLAEDITDETIEGVTFDSLDIGAPHAVTRCVFVDCTFRRVRFHGNGISGSGFVNCKFYDCEVSGECGDSWRTGGTAYPDAAFLDRLVTPPAAAADREASMDVEVLRQFWPKGRSYASNRLSLRTVYRGFSTEERQRVSDAIDALRRDGLIQQQGDAVVLNMTRMGDIRVRLGR